MQNDGRTVATHGSSAEASSASTGGRRSVARPRISDGRFGLDIFWIRRDVIDERTCRVEGGRAELLARAHFRNVGREQTADLNHRIAVMIRGNVKRHDDGGVVG